MNPGRSVGFWENETPDHHAPAIRDPYSRGADRRPDGPARDGRDDVGCVDVSDGGRYIDVPNVGCDGERHALLSVRVFGAG
jgi:hypothetical protein